MSYPDIEQPPLKKRRFFTEESPPPPDEGPQLPPNENIDAIDGFSKQTIESFVGEDVSDDILQRLRLASGNNMEQAINMYLDGSWKNATMLPGSASANTPGSLSPRNPLGDLQPINPGKKLESHSPSSVLQMDIMPECRYVGAFGVGAWATRSGTNFMKHGDVVKIERTKIKLPVKMGRGGKIIQPAKGSAARMRTDIIVRFTTVKGEEIGRLPKETAFWVSTLMDQNVCRFEGICVFVPDRVRVSDTIYLQLRCFLLKRAFGSRGLIKPTDNNRTTGIFEEKETTEEKELRLRQVALVKLFDEVNLHPCTINETTAKHKREGILQAAEVAEQHELDADGKKAKPSADGGSSPSEDSEPEEGKELEQDQLDSLYKKAQSFDFDTPTREPADSFVMELRKYQKQALHWMVSKEKDEKYDNKEASMHPLWEEYEWPVKDVDDKDVPGVINQRSFYVNPYSGELSLDFPVQEQHCLGGILADGRMTGSVIQTLLTVIEMGLGKTIEMLSLIHSHQSELATRLSETAQPSVADLPRLPINSSNVESAPCTTLVVAPMSLLAQWESETAKASKPGTLKSLVYYGSEKAANLQNLCCEANAAAAPNVIITSYGVVLSEFNQVASRGGDRGSHGGLFSLNFFRVILDEAHFIKNRQSKTAKACYEINAQHRWVLTGTPIVNRLEDLFSLVHFLRVEPWSNFSFWKTFITVPFESKDFIRALDVVQTVLEPLVLRRTKDMKTPDGEALVPLPPRTIEIEEIELSKQEREVYDYIYHRAKRTFNATMEAGTLLKSYTTIFAQILRLRQSCCHPILTRNKTIAAEEEEAAAASDIANGLADDMDLQELISRFTSDTESGEQDITNRFGAHVLQQIQSEVGNECPICAEEPMIEASVTGCWHSACKKCLLDYIEHQKAKQTLPLCFNCREPINQRDIFQIINHSATDLDSSLYSATPRPSPLGGGTPPAQISPPPPPPPRITLRRIGTTSSAKIAALLSHLSHIRSTSPTTKSVVFSQFTSFLDLIATELSRASIPFLRFDGAMSQKARATVLLQFDDNNSDNNSSTSRGKEGKKTGTVLLLSLRAGGVGLNLTMANRVFMMDPWWSFAVEAQAIDRVHRMGQEHPVRVVRFVVKGSIEGRMLRIQERKKFMYVFPQKHPSSLSFFFFLLPFCSSFPFFSFVSLDIFSPICDNNPTEKKLGELTFLTSLPPSQREFSRHDERRREETAADRGY